MMDVKDFCFENNEKLKGIMQQILKERSLELYQSWSSGLIEFNETTKEGRKIRFDAYLEETKDWLRNTSDSKLKSLLKDLEEETEVYYNCTLRKNSQNDETVEPIFRYLLEHKGHFDLKYLYEVEDYTNFIISQTELLKIEEDEIKKLVEDLVNIIMDRKRKNGVGARECTCCGIITLNSIPYTYRDTYGSVGRSYECPICSNHTHLGNSILRTQVRLHGKQGVFKTLDRYHDNRQFTLEETLEWLGVEYDCKERFNIETYCGDCTIIESGFFDLYAKIDWILEDKPVEIQSTHCYIEVDKPVTYGEMKLLFSIVKDLANCKEPENGEPNYNQITGDYSYQHCIKTLKKEGITYIPVSTFFEERKKELTETIAKVLSDCDILECVFISYVLEDEKVCRVRIDWSNEADSGSLSDFIIVNLKGEELAEIAEQYGISCVEY